MGIFKRRYNTLKFIREKKKRDELIKLSNEKKDFDYRRLLIEECEKDLHVIFSWKFLFEAFGILILIGNSFNYSKLSITFGILFLIIALLLNISYRKTLIKYKKFITIVDKVIEDEHGISLPKYL